MSKSPTMAKHAEYLICPTASNSIDIVGAYLACSRKRTALLLPCFDNLPLLMRRRNVNLVPLLEDDLFIFSSDKDALSNYFIENSLDALFIVNPNNPTGMIFNENQLSNIADVCRERTVILIIDATFSFYDRKKPDYHKILDSSGVKYVIIEDSGKTFPTQDMKASLMLFHSELKSAIQQIYEEIFLCVSPFILEVISRIVEKASEIGLEEVLWKEVDVRRTNFRNILNQTNLEIAKKSVESAMPLEWIDCSATGFSDLEFVQHCKAFGLCLLPGRYFYWSRPDELGHQFVRASLMKQDSVFELALQRLREAVSSAWR
ncbi:aminotransferase class I/II-fold pyridoxal phosphate-dependent enzyme [Candidatus Bartonella washoeensis]|nr:aminotransferase class I/II-fold pyridoxal phosphate-dependent enzyme [Bartonella washoeensis]